jgi:hypothetical protein
VSNAQLIVGGVLAVVWAILGYRLSENDRRALGRTPWGLPSAFWAFVWFLFVPLGLVLYLIAHSNGVRHFQQQSAPANRRTRDSPPPAGRPSAADLFPAYPRPANSRPDSIPAEEPSTATRSGATTGGAGKGTGEAGEAEQAGDGQESAPLSPPAWHADPSGRFHYRWWDGHEWTSHVSTDGHHLIDTNPDQRIGPYV